MPAMSASVMVAPPASVKVMVPPYPVDTSRSAPDALQCNKNRFYKKKGKKRGGKKGGNDEYVIELTRE